MKYIGENAIKKLISLIKGDLATKQPTITASGLLKGDGTGTVTAADTQEATLIDVPNGLLKGDGTTISAAVAETDYMVPPTGGTTGQILKKTETGTEWADTLFKPEGKSYLTFSSSNSFTLKVYDTTKHWGGTLEYFASDKTWTTWDGTTTLSSIDNNGEHVLYMRGTGNTVITREMSDHRWVLIGSDIACSGNIETLLDYATVQEGNHPTMGASCYTFMFADCTSLTTAPALPATTLTNECYYGMFNNCTSLTTAPALPATTLAGSCYHGMFNNCTSLTTAPALPATTLANQCYADMFQGCTSLIQAPALPATTLAQRCYYHMFYGCTSLTQAPALPATTLKNYCYESMFYGCTSLTQAPALPATTLAYYCYESMFYGCTSLTQAPALPATTLAESCYESMFYGCTSLTQAPALLATTLKDYCYKQMFFDCASLTQIPALTATTLESFCYQQMFQGCINIKLSSTKTEGYTQEYRIPMLETNGTGTSTGLDWMFYRTGGTFTGTPKINTTYYLSSDNMIVYNDNKVVTLNGYVGSMIDEVVQSTLRPLNKSVLLNNLKISLPSEKTWSSVTFGNNRFVAVASHSNIAAYSDDGITWTQTELPSSEEWSSVVFGNNRFVVVADFSKIAAYSDDGITWTQIDLPSDVYCSSVTFGNNRFVAVPKHSTILDKSSNIAVYSDDGITWTQTTLPSAEQWSSVAFGNGCFIAVVDYSTIAAYSYDGITWTQINLPSDVYCSSVTFGNNRFVAVASYSNIAAYSDDGITWTQTELPSTEQWSSVTFGNNRFIAVASNSNIAAYSDDGITWTQTELPSSEYWRSVAFGDNRFVTISRSTSAYSDDGINWYDNTDVLTYPDNTDIKDRIKNVLGIGQSISTEEVSSMIDVAIAAKMDSYTIKTAMDSVATPHTQYYLGNQTTVDIVLPDSANVGQIITVCWYNGDTAATLSITGTMLSFDYTPSANTRSEINALWDGTYWSVLGNEMAVPSEVTA